MPVASHPIKAVEIFCSYSHKDESLRDELAAHLRPLERQGKIKSWHYRMIKAGENWKGETDKQLETAHLLLLLISADFIKSDFCQIEMKRAMERYRASEARVIPIILRPCEWETPPLNEPQALPKDALPVTEWPSHDAAFKDVAKGIRAVVEELLDASPSVSTPLADPLKTPPRIFIPRPPVIGFVTRCDAEGRNIVGRLKEELSPQQNQLVTLSGPGGIGKTTLAAETARELKDVFKGRVVWSSADGRTEFSLSTLLDDISAQLGREDLRPLALDAKEAAVHALVADPPALVVLDNYETIKPDAQQSIERWFAQAPCSALFTSRQRIGATFFSVAVAAMSREEAREFLEKVIAQTQDAQIFSVEIRRRIYETAEANPYVMQWIVGQIDAAQEPQAVLEELQHGAGDAAERVFDRSFNLPQLGDDGRAALLALSFFAPNASRAALAEVAGFGDDSRRMNEAVKNLRALWLIKATDENRRFAIEGLTRSFAVARLSKDLRADEFRRRFVAYFLRHAQAHAQTTPEDFAALEAEKDNALNAMDAAFELKDWDSVVRIRFALEGFLDLRGYWDEAIQRGTLAVKAARSSQSESLIAALSHNVAVIYQRRGELDEARRLYNESLEINKRLGDQNGIAISLLTLGLLAEEDGNKVEAIRLMREALVIFEKLKSPDAEIARWNLERLESEST